MLNTYFETQVYDFVKKSWTKENRGKVHYEINEDFQDYVRKFLEERHYPVVDILADYSDDDDGDSE